MKPDTDQPVLAERPYCTHCHGKGFIDGLEIPCKWCNPGGEFRSLGFGKPMTEPVATLPAQTRFSVGDRVRSVNAPYLPTATVTEITERGFKYELERPMVISPRLGTQVGGESYDGSQWELVSAPQSGEPELPCPPHSPSGKLWHEWFERCGEHATIEVVNATATLVIEEKKLAAQPSPTPANEEVAREIVETWVNRYVGKVPNSGTYAELEQRITTALAETRRAQGTCEWTWNAHSMCWESECKHSLDINHNRLLGMKFCTFCGKPLVEAGKNTDGD